MGRGVHGTTRGQRVNNRCIIATEFSFMLCTCVVVLKQGVRVNRRSATPACSWTESRQVGQAPYNRSFTCGIITTRHPPTKLHVLAACINLMPNCLGAGVRLLLRMTVN